jgi:hypothetical protein
MTSLGHRAPALMKTPLLSQSSSGAAVSIWAEVRDVYSLATQRRRMSGPPGPQVHRVGR